MCGRYATTRSAADLSAIFEAADLTDGGLAPDYNVAPTDPVPVVRMSATAGGRVLSMARWGLVPAWAPDLKGAARMINARAETIATAKAFAKPFAVRRCLVPATGWYEWVAAAHSSAKQPYFMTRRDGGPVVFGGIWSVWGDAGAKVLTCSIVTMAAAGELASVHTRMPLMVAPDRWGAWLGATGDPSELLVPPSESDLAALEIRAVGTAVGDVRNDGPGLIEPLPPQAVDLTLF